MMFNQAIVRRRSDWNARFEYWEKPATVSEEGTITRAQEKVLASIERSVWLSNQQIVVLPQGSYHNNTNVRSDADIDLRVVHPAIKVVYDNGATPELASVALGYSDCGMTLHQIFVDMRSELMFHLSKAFGSDNVIAGNKAFRIRGITGSRADVDVVPAVKFHSVRWSATKMRYEVVEGVAIWSAAGNWTINFPDQHYQNGVAKRIRTALRFKRTVRMLKRLRGEMGEDGLLPVEVPSFLIECLVYAVEDAYFLVQSDDRYDRTRRVVDRMCALLGDGRVAPYMTEINEIKPLFAVGQKWTHADACAFASLAARRLDIS